MRNSIIGLVLLFGLALTIFVVRQDEQNPTLKIIQSDCHFEHGLCQVELSNTITLNFQLSPIGIPAMEPLFLKITGFDGLAKASDLIKVWFEGRDMSMGQHFMLPAQEQSVKDNTSLSKTIILNGMIPVCSVDEKMVWRLVVELPLALEQEERFKFRKNPGRQQIHFELP